jgi:glyoxylase-like metal-dependent hydrolase (beta-lactamase superfamily II)
MSTGSRSKGKGSRTNASKILDAVKRIYSGPIPVVDGVYQIRTLVARVTIVVGRDGLLVIDAGVRGSSTLIAAGLEALGASLNDVQLIALTHIHPDHAGGVGEFARTTGAQVAVHELEAEFVDGRKPPPNPFRNPTLAHLTQPFLLPSYSGPARVQCEFRDNDVLPWSEEVRVVHTPGHTPGSCCFYLPSRRLLITGDAMQYRFWRLGPPAGAVTLDRDLARASLARLRSLDIDCLCFSHFSPLKHGAADKIASLVQRSGET